MANPRQSILDWQWKTLVSWTSHLCPVHQHPFPILPLLVELQVRIWLPKKVLHRHRHSVVGTFCWLVSDFHCWWILNTPWVAEVPDYTFITQCQTLTKNVMTHTAAWKYWLAFLFSHGKNHIWSLVIGSWTVNFNINDLLHYKQSAQYKLHHNSWYRQRTGLILSTCQLNRINRQSRTHAQNFKCTYSLLSKLYLQSSCDWSIYLLNSWSLDQIVSQILMILIGLIRGKSIKSIIINQMKFIYKIMRRIQNISGQTCIKGVCGNWNEAFTTTYNHTPLK